MSESIRVGSMTPWGSADYAEVLTPGMVSVGTPSHGGIHLDPQLNGQIPAAFRDRRGWYEEDCAVNVVVAVFPGVFASRMDPAKGLEKVHDALAYWFPRQHNRAFPEEAAKRAGRATSDA